MAILLRAGVALRFWYSPPSASRPDASKDIFRGLVLCFPRIRLRLVVLDTQSAVETAYRAYFATPNHQDHTHRVDICWMRHRRSRESPLLLLHVHVAHPRLVCYHLRQQRYRRNSLPSPPFFKKLWRQGYTYAGLEYADECWCGNSLANSLGVATDASQCNMKCTGLFSLRSS
jgi:hypothetical protein